jgi:hypothetical protein
MTQREKLLDKIRALLSKTTANGCTEFEMFASLAKARAMRDAYVVTDQELHSTKLDAAVLHEEDEDPNDPHKIKRQIAVAVAKFCDCEVWRNPARGYTFCGFASDTQWAAWLLDHLTDFIASELVLHLMTSLAAPRERAKVIKGFIIGCADRINERIDELCKPPVGQSDNSKALVTIKAGAIADKLKEIGLKFQKSRTRCNSYDDGALEAGRKAGDQASFGRPVSGAAGALRLGRA